MVGVPTNADAGVLELQLVAVRQRPRRSNGELEPARETDSSDPIWFTILVEEDRRPAPNPVLFVEMIAAPPFTDLRGRRQQAEGAGAASLVSVPGFEIELDSVRATNSTALSTEADSAADPAAVCFGGQSRARFVRAVAELIGADSTDSVNLLTAVVKAPTKQSEFCQIEVTVGDNEQLDCEAGAERALRLTQPGDVARELWTTFLSAEDSELTVEAVGVASVQDCLGVDPSVGTSAVPPKQNKRMVMAISTIIGSLVLFLAVLLAILFRRRALKDAKGITDTFAPRRLITLNEERRLPYDELSTGLGLSALEGDYMPRPAAYHDSPYFRDAPPFREPPSYVPSPPQYKMPPAYPHDTSKITADYMGLLADREPEYETEIETKITTTTTIEEYPPFGYSDEDDMYGHHDDAPPPAFIAPPSYADAGFDDRDDEVFIAPTPREKVSSKTASRRLSVGTDVDVEDDMRGSNRALGTSGRWSPGVSSNGSSRSPVRSPRKTSARPSRGGGRSRNRTRSGSQSQRSGFATGEDSEEEGYNAGGGTTSGWSDADAVSGGGSGSGGGGGIATGAGLKEPRLRRSISDHSGQSDDSPTGGLFGLGGRGTNDGAAGGPRQQPSFFGRVAEPGDRRVAKLASQSYHDGDYGDYADSRGDRGDIDAIVPVTPRNKLLGAARLMGHTVGAAVTTAYSPGPASARSDGSDAVFFSASSPYAETGGGGSKFFGGAESTSFVNDGRQERGGGKGGNQKSNLFAAAHGLSAEVDTVVLDMSVSESAPPPPKTPPPPLREAASNEPRL